MPFRIPNIENRISVCAANDLPLILSGNQVNVGAIITASNARSREINDINFDVIPNHISCYYSLSSNSDLNDAKTAIETDLITAEQFLLDMDKDDHLIIHCEAGMHRSPLFLLTLLLHLQDGAPNNDEAICTMHSITPENSCLSPEKSSRLFWGDRYESICDDLLAYWMAQHIARAKAPVFSDKQLSKFFSETTQSSVQKEGALCRRFGFKQPPHTL